MVIINDGIVRKECNFDIYKLYNYLYSRNFDYLVNIVDYNNREVSFKYEEDYSIDNKQKGIDLIRLVGLLHSKTSYNKEVSKDKYKSIYDDLNNNILYLSNYYNDLFDRFINVEYLMPSSYLFLNNYYVIDSALKYCSSLLNSWNLEVSDGKEQRVSLVHNNLRLDHYIKNDREYLISFDNYIIDSPVIDLYKFYKNEWMEVNISELYDEYSSLCKLSNDEEMLLQIMICMPYKIEFSDDEIDNVKNVRSLIDYLVNSFKIIKE